MKENLDRRIEHGIGIERPPIGLAEEFRRQSVEDERAQEAKTKRYLHPPAFRDGCYYCHQPHGSENPTLLRTANVNELCLTCHSIEPLVKSSADSKTITAFNGKLELPGDYLDSVRRIEVSSSGIGHPQADHPVSGVDDPSNPGHKLSCISCHDPHASNFSKRMFRMDTSTKAICFKCHATEKKAQK